MAESNTDSHRHTRIVAVGNQKGGVGKTTNTVHIARALAELGRKVLIIDLDMNHGATRHFGIEPEAFLGSFEMLAGEEPAENLVLTSSDKEEGVVQQRGPIGSRVLHGLLSLAGKHPVAALEGAAEKALHHGAWRLRDLRTLLDRARPSPQLDFLDTHPLIRSLDAYEALTPDCFNPQPQTIYEQP